MFFFSSKRALSSTRAATCLPLSAARTSDLMMEVSEDVRYSVSLMARTCGSRDAWRMNSSTELENDSYGWCTSTSPSRMTENRSTGSSISGLWSRGWVIGTHGSSFRSGRSSPCTDHRPPRSSGTLQ